MDKKKIEKLLELFNEIEKLFPDKVDLNVHNIEVKDLSDDWEIEALYIREGKRVCLTAKNKKYDGLTLFGKP